MVLSVLLIEDDEFDGELIEKLIVHNAICPIDVHRVQSMRSAFRYVQDHDVHVALLDLNLPDSQGILSLQELQACDARLPVVIVTGLESHEVAVEAIAAGAQDFISKHGLSGGQLMRSILFAKTRHDKMMGLKASADVDPLTGLQNRRSLAATFEELRPYGADDDGLSVLLLDVDYFKSINDEYGHLSGDAVLRRLGGLLSSHSSDNHRVFRYGGEEFAYLCRGSSSSNRGHARKILETIRSSSFQVSNAELKVTASIGVTDVQEKESYEQAFSRCDRALYNAKTTGRDRLCIL